MPADAPFSLLVEAYEQMEATTKRLELTDILVGLFQKLPKDIIDKAVYLTQGKLYPDYLGIEIGLGEKLTLRAIAKSSGIPQNKVEEIYKKLGDLGTVAEKVIKEKKQITFFKQPLTIKRVHGTLDKMAKTSGEKSQDIKLKLLVSLLNDAEPEEARYIVRIVLGKLRLGVADYTVLDALAIAFTGSKDNREILERAYNLSSDLGTVAKVVATGGLEAAKTFKIEVGRPIRPMLAERLTTPQEIVAKIGGLCAAEYKYDGERVQIHKNAEDVNLFSRRLENITSHYPDVIELIRKNVKAEKAIIEGEIVAVDIDTGDFLPFQELMHRRRKYGIEEAMDKYPVSLFLFDILYADGVDYTIKPYSERREALMKLVNLSDRIQLAKVIFTDDPKEIERFMEQAIQDGCEGLVVKDPKSVYRAGAREFLWIKLKREYRSELTDTIDLVIVGAFHGRGRRAGRYGAYLMAAYDDEADVFRTTCKVGTGLTDEDLERFTEMLQPLKLERRHPRVDSKMEADVWVVPEIVIEIIASEITLSPIHTAGFGSIKPGSGLALRFPKFTGRIRDDKRPEDATTVKELIEMYKNQLKAIKEEISPI
jgi:DNA ligase-1